MTTTMVMAMVALGVIAIVLVAVVTPKLVFSFMRGPLEARIAAHYGPGEVLMQDLTANSFGLESKGVWQGRGNGALVLTDDYLHFFRFVRGADLRVPLGAITDLAFTRSHLGKATIRDLLKVRFTVDGMPDSIAWYLTDPRAWKARIEEVQGAPSGSPGA